MKIQLPILFPAQIFAAPEPHATLGRVPLRRAAFGGPRFVFALLLPLSLLQAAPGDVDTGFNPAVNNIVSTVAVQPDGKILLGGDFTRSGSTTRNHIARFNADGTLDTGFNPNASGGPFSIAVQADGKILFGGNFDRVRGRTRRFLARVNADGTLDTAFNPSVDGSVMSIAVQADGKILLGGAFTNVDGSIRKRLARLNADGTLDAGFAPNANDSVLRIAEQADGKILLAGQFTNVRGQTRNRVARLNANGTLDTSFDPNVDGLVWSMAVQADGKILLGGQFTSVGGAARAYIARLNIDGTLDAAFAATANTEVTGLAVQADGKILLIGGFSSVDNTSRRGFARVNVDGTLDTRLAPNVSGGITCLAVQADGEILVAGPFTSMGGQPRNHIARLDNDAATQTLAAMRPSRVEWQRGGAAPEVSQVTFELSTDGGTTWTPLGAGTRIAGGWELRGLTLPASGGLRARGRASSGGFANDCAGLVEQVQGFPLSAPAVLASARAGISATTVILGGEVTFDGNSPITERGIVYAQTAINPDPRINGPDVTNVAFSGTVGAFTTDITGLSPGVAYSYAAYAANALGTTYTSVGTFTTRNTGVTATLGGSVSFTAPDLGGSGPISYQWRKNGAIIEGATDASLVISEVQPSEVGLYSVEVSVAGAVTKTTEEMLGLGAASKVTGEGEAVGADIVHPNTNIFDQVLLTGPAATITADLGQVTRASFIDLNDDIVQVEFSGAGSLSLVLDNPTGPAQPVNYSQPTNYLKGHAGIVIVGADETSNVSVFSVGRATAFDPTGNYDITKPISATNDPATNGSSLFVGHDATRYDGIADIAFIAILSTDGKFGGVRTANAHYFAQRGLTGIYAPGITFTGPIYIGNVTAFDDATPVMQVDSVTDARITGGDLFQDNGAAVVVSGLTQLQFTAGVDSSGNVRTAKTNQARLERDGVDVTAQIVVNPTP